METQPPHVETQPPHVETQPPHVETQPPPGRSPGAKPDALGATRDGDAVAATRTLQVGDKLFPPDGIDAVVENCDQNTAWLRMVSLSRNVDTSVATAWATALAPVLLEGEVIRALARSRSAFVRDGIAFTNARIFTFYSSASADRRIVDWIGNDKIRRLVTTVKVFRRHLEIEGDDEAIQLGGVSPSELDFVEAQIREARRTGIDPAASEAMELLELEQSIEKLEREELLDARSKVPVVGDPLTPAQWESIHSRARGKELPWLVLSNEGVGCIACFDDRLAILKTGGLLVSAVSGSLNTGSSATFQYSEIIAIQHIGKQLDGVLEIVTPTKPSLTTSLEVGKKIGDERWKRTNCLPLPRFQYSLWSSHIDQIGRRIAAARRGS